MADTLVIPDDGTYPRLQQYFTPSSTNQHTMSVWIRSLSGDCDCFLGIFRNSPWNLPGSTVVAVTSEWQKFSFTMTPPDTTTHVAYIGSHDTAAQKGNTLELWGAMIQESTHPTPFTAGTRSATQGLIDLTGNSTIDLTNVSFDSNAQMTFDGTDDILSTGLFGGRNPSTDPFTVEAWVKSDVTSANKIWVDATGNGTNQRFYAALIDSTSPSIGIQGSSWSDTVPAHTNWTHQVIVMDGSRAKAYADGEFKFEKSYTSYNLFGDINVGGRSSYRWVGKISMFKIYNRALTASEIKANYNAIKGRFNI